MEKSLPETFDPVSVADLPKFMAAISPIIKEIAGVIALRDYEKGGAFVVMQLLSDTENVERNIEAVITATAIGAKVDRAWLGQQKPDVLVELASRVLEVNWDFFVRRVLPAINQAAERLMMIASGGTSGSPGSSAQDSPTAT